MFLNLYGKQLLRSLRNRSFLIWLLIFPILLSTLFSFTFSSLDETDNLKTIAIGVVDDANYQAESAFVQTLEAVSEDGADDDSRLFEISYCQDFEAADALLKDGKIYGYYYVQDGAPRLVVTQTGMLESIAKSFLDQYIQTKGSIETILREKPEAAADIQLLMDYRSYISQIIPSKNAPTEKVNYFYALLAMVCLYGSLLGMEAACDLQANLSPQGARRSVSPVRRGKLVAADLLAGITVQAIAVCLVIFYINFILGVNFGSQMLPVVLTGIVGSITGVAFGALVASTNRLRATVKSAILICVVMVCSFLAGLMVNGINYTVMQKAPVLAWLNPAARITDAFYCLYYYDNYDRYFMNMGILLAMAAVMLGVATLFIRRQQYESI